MFFFCDRCSLYTKNKKNLLLRNESNSDWWRTLTIFIYNTAITIATGFFFVIGCFNSKWNYVFIQRIKVINFSWNPLYLLNSVVDAKFFFYDRSSIYTIDITIYFQEMKVTVTDEESLTIIMHNTTVTTANFFSWSGALILNEAMFFSGNWK